MTNKSTQPTSLKKRILAKFVLLLPKFLTKNVFSLYQYWFHEKKIPDTFWEANSFFPILKNPVVILGHANFLHSTGGTEYAILQYAEELLEKNQDFIYLCPEVSRGNSVITSSKRLQLIVNGHHFGTISIFESLSFLQQQKPVKIVVHHTLRWPLCLVKRVIKTFDAAITVHIHDFLFKCPLINYRCHHGENLCQNKYASWYIQYWKRHMAALLEKADQIFVPSEFVLTTIDKQFLPKTKVLAPNLNFKFPSTRKPTLAYLGYASDIKGYNTWIKLAHNSLVNRIVHLIHVGNRPSEILTVPCFKYDFSKEKLPQAIEILKKETVDAVLLWSQVPETFSFTMHEALAANCFIIASPKSGNIAYTLKNDKNIKGVILENDYALTQFILKNHPQLNKTDKTV